MIVTRRFPPRLVVQFALPMFTFGAVWAFVVFALYSWAGLHLIKMPFLPIATVGTAVAFYVGFKNNAAYERFWEGRKI
jgi:putative membrane protein